MIQLRNLLYIYLYFHRTKDKKEKNKKKRKREKQHRRPRLQQSRPAAPGVNPSRKAQPEAWPDQPRTSAAEHERRRRCCPLNNNSRQQNERRPPGLQSELDFLKRGWGPALPPIHFFIFSIYISWVFFFSAQSRIN